MQSNLIVSIIMLRIAVAGTGGLARHIAWWIRAQSHHPVILLSRSAKPELTQQGYQVYVVNYDDPTSLRFALSGVDTVISTVSGVPQINLIDAAAQVPVRRFAPAEFEGSPSARPQQQDPLDPAGYKSAALQRLNYYSQNVGIQWISFVSGIFYERFAPGGLRGKGIGRSLSLNGEGDFIIDIRRMTAQIPLYTSNGEFVYVCMTSIQDFSRFVVSALEWPHWAGEARVYGQRISVWDLVLTAETMRGRTCDPRELHNPESLALLIAPTSRRSPERLRLQTLLATAHGRFDFEPTMTLNFVPTTFSTWLTQAWANQ